MNKTLEAVNLDGIEKVCLTTKLNGGQCVPYIDVEASSDQTASTESICAVRIVKTINPQDGGPVQTEGSSYYCNFCHFVSTDSSLLQQHVSQHRFHCSSCDFQDFTRLAVMKHFRLKHSHNDYKNVFFCRYTLKPVSVKRKIVEVESESESGDVDSIVDIESSDGSVISSTIQTLAGKRTMGPASKRLMGPACKRAKPEESDKVIRQILKHQGNAKVVLSKLPEDFVTSKIDKSTDTEKYVEMEEEKESSDLPKEMEQGKIAIMKKEPEEQPIERAEATKKVEATIVEATKRVEANKTVIATKKVEEPQRRLSPRVAKRLADFVSKKAENQKETEVLVKTEVVDLEEEVEDHPLPVITNVVGGAESVRKILSASGQGSGEANKAAQPVTRGRTNASTDQAKKQLYWKCSYCTFRSVRQVNVTHHISATHPNKPHKYVGTFVDELPPELLEPNNSGDNQVDPNKANKPVAIAPKVVPLQPQQMKAPAAPESAKVTTTDSSSSKAAAKDVPSFKCAHCTFNSSEIKYVKKHMLRQHVGSVLYALDMKAVKLNERRYVLFCLKDACDFETKDVDDYMDHVNACTPWSTEGNQEKGMKLKAKSLELTKKFVPKINQLSNESSVHRKNRVNYCCTHCNYCSSSNMTMVKKHMVATHSKKVMAIQVIPADKRVEKYQVIFCRYCFWDTKKTSNLIDHMKSKHPTEKSDLQTVEENDNADANNTADSDKSKPSNDSDNSNGGDNNPAADDDEDSSDVYIDCEPISDDPNTVPDVSNVGNTVIITTDSESNDNEELERFKTGKDERMSEDYQEDDGEATFFTSYQPFLSNEVLSDLVHTFMTTECNFKWRKERLVALGLPGMEKLIKEKGINVPRLYQCLTCSKSVFGVFPMKRHLKKCHDWVPTQATDVFRKEIQKSPEYTTSFCPMPTCDYYTYNVKDLVQHAQQKHILRDDNNELCKFGVMAGKDQVIFQCAPQAYQAATTGVTSPASNPGGSPTSTKTPNSTSPPGIKIITSKHAAVPPASVVRPGSYIIRLDSTPKSTVLPTLLTYTSSTAPTRFTSPNSASAVLKKIAAGSAVTVNQHVGPKPRTAILQKVRAKVISSSPSTVEKQSVSNSVNIVRQLTSNSVGTVLAQLGSSGATSSQREINSAVQVVVQNSDKREVSVKVEPVDPDEAKATIETATPSQSLVKIENTDPQEEQGSSQQTDGHVPVQVQCLYCSGKVIFDSFQEIKDHLVKFHYHDDFVFRDNIARMLNISSKMYVCKEMTCNFTTNIYQSYSLHMQGHESGAIA